MLSSYPRPAGSAADGAPRDAGGTDAARAAPPKLKAILRQAAVLYESAADFYNALAEIDRNQEIFVFWKNLARNMSGYADCWERLSNSVPGHMVAHASRLPSDTLKHLARIAAELDRAKREFNLRTGFPDTLFLAYGAEAHLTHSALTSLFVTSRFLTTEDPTQYDYAHHLRQFVAGFLSHGGRKFLNDALASALLRNWQNNRELLEDEMLDPVTGAYSLHGLLRVMESVGNLAQRNRYTSAVLMVHIPGLDDLCTTSGLKEVRSRLSQAYSILKQIVRKSDLIGKQDFATFLVFLPHVKHQHLHDIATRISRVLSKESPVEIGGSYCTLEGRDIRKATLALIETAQDCARRASFSRKLKIVIE